MLALRTATATNYNGIEKGDAVLQSTNLMSAAMECFAIFLAAGKKYNKNNTEVQAPLPDVSSDDNEGSYNGTVVVPYKTVAGVKVYSTLFDSESSWVIPTSGELKDKTLAEALVYLYEAVDTGFQNLDETIAIKDLRELISVVHNGSNCTITSAMPYRPVVDATGQLVIATQNVLSFLDQQEGYPV
jgi:hypothetical protein